MQGGIVVINDNPHVDMAWQCHTQGEAERMVTWLKDHHINARWFDNLTDWERWAVDEMQKEKWK